MRHSTPIARIDPGAFQMLPDGPALRLDLANAWHRQRMRELIAERVRAQLPTPAELDESIALLSRHGVRAWRHRSEVRTTYGELPFLESAATAEMAVQSWLKLVARGSREEVLKLVLARVANAAHVRVRSKKGKV